MTRMIQKSIYIDPEQDASLKKLAKLLGISQSELIRLAIHAYIDDGPEDATEMTSSQSQREGETEPLWLKHMREGTFRHPLADGEVLWDRESIYEERINSIPG